jgi:hypothetical protein
LKLEPNPYARLDAPQLPQPRLFEFKPLKETVPVFEGRFRMTQDVILAVRDDIAPLLASPDPTLVLKGVVEYQVCSDAVCHPPGSLPVTWSLRVRPLDREPPRRRGSGPPGPDPDGGSAAAHAGGRGTLLPMRVHRALGGRILDPRTFSRDP